mgnify:CR=1 FL=1
MKKDDYLDKLISKQITEANIAESAKHKSSGKLSASMLGQPLQWQILKIMGIPSKPFDEYTLRKFVRGKDIENWLLERMPDVVGKQKFVEYRNCVGYVDALADTKDWDFADGIIPAEIKSVSNLKYKKILKQGADRSHKLQAGFYAICEGLPHYAVIYVASDDLRVSTYVYETADVKDEIDGIITRFDEKRLKGVPVFVPEEDWQKKAMYNNFPEWAELNQEEVNKKVELNK